MVPLTTSLLMEFPQCLIFGSRNTLWNIVVTYTYKGRLSVFIIYIFQVCRRCMNNNSQIFFLVSTTSRKKKKVHEKLQVYKES